MAWTVNCSQCGAPGNTADKFCGACGATRLAPDTAEAPMPRAPAPDIAEAPKPRAPLPVEAVAPRSVSAVVDPDVDILRASGSCSAGQRGGSSATRTIGHEERSVAGAERLAARPPGGRGSAEL